MTSAEQREAFKQEMEGGVFAAQLEDIKARVVQIYAGYEALPTEDRAKVNACMQGMEQAIKDKKSMADILGFASKALSIVKLVL